MPYLLRFDGVNDEVQHPEVLNGATSFDVEIDLVPRTIISGYAIVYSSGEPVVSSRQTLYFFGSSRAELAFIIGGVRRVIEAPSGTFTSGTRYKINAVYNGSTLQMLVNGSSVASIAATGAVGGVGLRRIGTPASVESRAAIDLYGYKITVNGTLTRFYDPSNTNSGTALPETVNNQNGTLVNFTVPDCWVFYSSGATYDLQALGGTFTYSGASAALNRGFRLDATGGTFSYSGAVADLTYSTATVYRIDALGGNFTYTGAQATLLRNFRVDATGGAYSYVGGVASLSRGYMMQSQGGTFGYAGADASLTYVSGPMVYTITALGGAFSYTGAAAEFTATGVIPAANPAAFVNRAYVGGRLTNSAKIGGRLTNNATVAI